MTIPIKKLNEISRWIRRKTVEIAFHSKSGHIGSALSVIEILTVLYFHFLRMDPKNPKKRTRDRLILSKGHGANALYATLCRRGFFPESWLKDYLCDGSSLGVHPVSHAIPGIEFATGSLGHGLSVAVGMALAAKYNKEKYRVVVILSDGECNEGSVWEAAMSASQFQLDNLIVIVDYNKIQAFGRTKDVMNLEPFREKWKSFGFHVLEVNGHDIKEILQALEKNPVQKKTPHILIAHTVKGHGISFMKDTIASHYQVLNEEQFNMALKELS